jgi:mono/diheme cytochrome c family protein
MKYVFIILMGILSIQLVNANNVYDSEQVTFNKNIRPIFQTNCSSCHPGIVNYSIAFEQKNKIFKKVTNLNKQMPPPYISPRLSKGEVELIKQWVKGGAKE